MKNQPAIRSTVLPDKELDFNNWAKYIHKELIKINKRSKSR